MNEHPDYFEETPRHVEQEQLSSEALSGILGAVYFDKPEEFRRDMQVVLDSDDAYILDVFPSVQVYSARYWFTELIRERADVERMIAKLGYRDGEAVPSLRRYQLDCVLEEGYRQQFIDQDELCLLSEELSCGNYFGDRLLALEDVLLVNSTRGYWLAEAARLGHISVSSGASDWQVFRAIVEAVRERQFEERIMSDQADGIVDHRYFYGELDAVMEGLVHLFLDGELAFEYLVPVFSAPSVHHMAKEASLLHWAYFISHYRKALGEAVALEKVRGEFSGDLQEAYYLYERSLFRIIAEQPGAEVLRWM